SPSPATTPAPPAGSDNLSSPTASLADEVKQPPVRVGAGGVCILAQAGHGRPPMDLATIIGLVLAWGAVVYSMFHASHGAVGAYVKPGEMFLVFGGSI